VDARFGTIEDLQAVQNSLQENGMYLMTDIVLNHTSRQHAWAKKALSGDTDYQAYYYFYDDRTIPDLMEASMPEIFPESSPGSFSYVRELGKWVMTVFHDYQWDLNYTNPAVFNAMLEIILFYANLGVDILRIDAPAFIWKEPGTTCQNLPKAHTLLRLIKLCVQVAAPGMALLGEAIVAPKEIMQYFGTGAYRGQECDFAYNATQMALQWDALATADTRIMLAAQEDLLQKPDGASWINYTRCHDDIGLGFEDASIAAAGFDPYAHRGFLKNYYAGIYPGSPAAGALFSVNPKTQDARISGSLASLCGLEKAMTENDQTAIDRSLKKIILLQAQTCFLCGLPMLFYGDEAGYTNDYSYLDDPGKSYDNRWMHRPVINWAKNERRKINGTNEAFLFQATRRLLQIRSSLPLLRDHSNIRWLKPYNIHIAGFLRMQGDHKLYCLFNYSDKPAYLTWYALKEHGAIPKKLLDHWSENRYRVGEDYEYLVLDSYAFLILEVIE
ncbi:MAG TPA: alpha-amylase family glycosyl hydrolase, partial [Sediminibacterium sp.]|nr:alpha-amylase family glycosyl hydrolase [Sediminibacterium sp.]